MTPFSTNYRMIPMDDKPTYWLAPVPDSIILTREDFEKTRREIAADAFHAGCLRGQAEELYAEGQISDSDYETIPDEQQYLDSLTK